MSTRTKYGSKKAIDVVFSKAKTVRGKDPNTHRRDASGNIIYRNSYGKSSDMGWEIDHIKPKARGGSDDIVNLQALKTTVNRAKSDSLVKASRHSQR